MGGPAGGDVKLRGEVVLMARNPYEPKGFDKWGPTAWLVRGVNELFGSGRKRWLEEQARKAKRGERDESGAASPEDS